MSLAVETAWLCKAIHNYKAETSGEMNLRVGDIIMVTDISDPEFWSGEHYAYFGKARGPI